MNKFSAILCINLFFLTTAVAFNCPVTPSEEIPEYYATIDGESGKELLDAIQQVAKVGYRTTDFRYDSVWIAFEYTDLRADGYVWEIYSDCQFVFEEDRTANTSQTGECKGYNREHAMCQSWFGTTSLAGKAMSSSKKNSPGSDIFHIYPTSYGMNSRRGNRPYGEVQKADYTSGNGTQYGAPITTMAIDNSVAGAYVVGKIALSTNVLEPADEYKGDIARSYFGTMVKWAGEWAFNKNENGRVIFDATIDADTHYASENNYGLTDYGLALLLKWHRQDPVSQKEVDRNNGIQRTQGNRNPFIDYPYLVEYIWGEQSGEVVVMDYLLCSADERFELGVSDGYIGEDVDYTTDTIFWMVGDEVYSTTVVKSGTSLRQLPQTPTSCSAISTTFIGWTTLPIRTATAEAPEVLYTAITDFPTVNGDAYYYAVFAQQLSADSEQQIVHLDRDSTEGWTLNNLKSSSNNSYWIMAKEASIVSPSINLSQVDSISLLLRTYYNYGTLQISAADEVIATVTATTNTFTHYPLSNIHYPLSNTQSPLSFTGVDGTETRGVGLQEITIYLSNQTTTYTHYLTHCSQGPITGLCTIQQTSTIQKVLRHGQLLILYDGKTYNAQGTLLYNTTPH